MIPDLLDQCFVRESSMVFRKIADECLLVPVRQNVADLGKIYLLNEVGGRIWELLDGQRLVRDIRDLIAAEFEVSVSEAETDVTGFFQQLLEIQGIKAV
jgi:hypothetical protein